ncbi:MAG: FecR domain-containing protein [Huintestinicola sp.]|uniref:FecR family protein n=1 Tax=Huintestinicola sp. TaxID=2981661 RepID=UPI003F0A4F96
MSVKTFFAAMTLKVKIIVVCTAVAVTSATAVAVGVAVTKEDAYRVLKVFEMTGSAVVERNGSGSLDAYVGMNLESGDTLTVGDDSTLRISMDNDKYVLLDSGTVLELTATGSSSDSRTSIDLKKGTILNEITTPLSANSSYEVATPKATMAVRGTSFTVSVNADSEGGYIIREDTFNGNVEVTLLDEEGNPRNEKALVPADKGVTIRTEPDKESGNPAEVDGTSRFVFEDENGVISELAEGADPIRDIRYDMVSATIRENILRSNDENLMALDDMIVAKLRGRDSSTEETKQTTVAVSETETTPAETTVPETSVITSEQTRATPSETTVTSVSSEPVTTSVPETSAETVSTEVTSDTQAAETTVTETSSDESESESSETSSDTKTETSTSESSETTVATLPVTNASDGASYTGQPGSADLVPVETASDEDENEFEVKFLCDGSLLYTATVKSGETVGYIPDIPEKTGYTAKWMFGGKEFTSETEVTSDMVVVAVYTIKSFKVNFTAEADTPYSYTVTADYGTLLADILPDVPEKTGYTGVWKIGGTVNITGSITVTSDILIKAVYTINTYTVTITAEGDTTYSDTQTVEYGTPLADLLPADVPEKTGHDGVWTVNGKEYTSDYVITGDTVVTAVYTIKTYIVTFLSSDGSVYATREAKYNTTVTDIPDVPEKSGYIVKWMYDGSEFTSEIVITEDIVVTAEETEAVTLTFQFVSKPAESYIIPKGTSFENNDLSMPEPDADAYYSVTGWQTDTYEEVDESTVFTESLTLIPNQTAITYHVVFYDTDGTTEVDARYLTYSEVITVWISLISDVDADFWLVYSEDGSSSRTVTASDTVGGLVDEYGFTEASDIKIAAAIEVSTLTWYDENGTSHTDTVRKSGNLFETLDSLHTLPDGYVWAGDDRYTPIDSSLTCSEDMTVYAAITVTFEFSSLPSETVNLPLGGCLNDVGESLPNNGASQYHTLIWSNNSTEVNEYTTFDEPVTLTSTETPIQYTIIFNFEGNTSDPTITTSGIFSDKVMDLYAASGGYAYAEDDVLIQYTYYSKEFEMYQDIVIDSNTLVSELAAELDEGETVIIITVYVF